MSLTFHVLDCDHDAERREIRVTGTIDDGILVTGMLARSEGRSSTVQEIEMVPDEGRVSVFRLTFSAADDADPRAWTEEWAGASTLTLDY
jgi:hypothetical protein